MKYSIESANQALAALKEKVKTTYYPQLHIAPPAGWMNDPNGLIYFADQYHVFYQHYPYNENWGPMHWGHATSSDLVYWQHQPIALAPDQDYDKGGCFSGSAVNNNGVLTLIYTGHVWLNLPHDDSAIKEVQCLATSEDGINFTKHGIILNPPEGIMHFRDPKVWQVSSDWFMVVGARTADDIGQVLLYRSTNLFDWVYQGVLAQSKTGESYMWECPDFFPLADKYVLMFSPQGLAAKGYHYRNKFQSGYLIGHWQPEQPFVIEHEFQELDLGHDFYAPQSFLAADDRRMIFAWMDMWESEMPAKLDFWAGSLTLPRQLQLNDAKNKLCSLPADELCQLRNNNITLNALNIRNERHSLQLPITQHEIEITFDLTNSDAERFGLELAATQDGLHGTQLYIDKQAERLILDRSRSGLGVNGYRSAPLLNQTQLQLRIFIDTSSIEVFVNQGEITLTSRIYPLTEERTINLFAENGCAQISSLTYWQLASVFKK